MINSTENQIIHIVSTMKNGSVIEGTSSSITNLKEVVQYLQ
jgi:hypothetical protein